MVRHTRNRLYTHPTSCRTYRIKIVKPAHTVSSRNIKRNLLNLQIYLLELKFDGNDPITIINFLTEFSSTGDDLQLIELDSYLSLGNFIRADASSHYRTAVQSSSRTGMLVASWPQAVAFFLKKYAINEAIKNTRDDVFSLRKRATGTKELFYTRFVNAHSRAGSP